MKKLELAWHQRKLVIAAKLGEVVREQSSFQVEMDDMALFLRESGSMSINFQDVANSRLIVLARNQTKTQLKLDYMKLQQREIEKNETIIKRLRSKLKIELEQKRVEAELSEILERILNTDTDSTGKFATSTL